jgi:DNA-binding cell septation regulator SpoVG
MNKGSWGKVRAFFDIMTDEGFTIKGFKIIEGINGLFVGVPSQKGKDDEYFDTIFVAPELREELNHVALQAYGMEDAPPADNFSFPEKKMEQNNTEPEAISESIKETGVSESSPSNQHGHDEPVKYSDDDIPF